MSFGVSAHASCQPVPQPDTRTIERLGERLAEQDIAVTRAHPEFLRDISLSIGRPDTAGRLGRNRAWGDWHSVRFQYGAGRAMRYGLAVKDQALIDMSRQAIRAGLNTQSADGGFPATLPKGMTQPGPSDRLSATAFFLSDICPALLVVGPTDQERAQVSRALVWLSDHRERLMRKDANAPNRLLINALAFVGCGQLVEDIDLQNHAAPFFTRANAQYENGIFMESGGSDTSYQSVALVPLGDMLTLYPQDVSLIDMETTWVAGGGWLSNQISSDGRLDSSANTRSCTTEVFMGRPKDVDLREVFLALAKYEQAGHAVRHMGAFKQWLRTKPDSCARL